MKVLYHDRKKQHIGLVHLMIGILSGLVCVLMVLFPEMTLESAKRGIQLWASCVLPALLPFFICANFMIALGIPMLFGRCFEPLFQRMFRVPGIAAFVFFMSITSGYPMGAKLIGDLRREGKITQSEAKRMVSFCTTTGPLFILGAVGTTMLHCAFLGGMIAAAHYGGAVLNGILFGYAGGKKSQTEKKTTSGSDSFPYQREERPHKEKDSFLTEFTDAILSSIRTLGIICGYLVVFCLLIDFIQASGALQVLKNPVEQALAKGFIEMTVGCNALAALPAVPIEILCACCGFLISFGGCSVLFQSMSMLQGTGVTVVDYGIRKLSHGLLSAGLAYGLAKCLGPMDSPVGAFPQMEQMQQQLSGMYGFVFSMKMMGLVCVMMIALILWNEWWMDRQTKKRNNKQQTEGNAE